MGENFNQEELRILLYLAKRRLRYESQRKSFIRDGVDVQSQKVWDLKELSEKIERMMH